MGGLKLDDSIFDTSADKYKDWNFGTTNIVKDTVNTANNSDIIDINKNTTLKQTEDTGNSFIDSITNWWGGNETSQPPKTETDTGMFSGANIGSTLKGGGAVVGALSSVYGTLEQTKFNKETLNMEKDRINRNIAREDKIQKNYEGVWG